MDFLPSALLARVPGLIHAFGQRIAGSREEAREAARRGFRDRGDLFFLKQVHGCAVVQIPFEGAPEADASLTQTPGSLLAIETADCLPIFIVDPIGGRVAAAHAGWRGTVARVAQAAVRELVAAGSRPRDLLAALGPAIGSCCYEVGDDVEHAFGALGAKFLRPGKGRRKHLDIGAANREQLLEAGIELGRIEKLDLCTQCRADLFFSYRRDGAEAGRMISVVGFGRLAASSRLAPQL